MGCDKEKKQTETVDNKPKKMNIFLSLFIFTLVVAFSPLITIAIIYMMFNHIVLGRGGVNDINNIIISTGEKIINKKNK